MTLEQALHQRWSDDPTLNALLPSDKVTTGRSTGGTLPRATIGRRTRRAVCRTNSGDSLEQVVVEVRLLHGSFDDGTAVVQQFLAVFDRSQFGLSGGAEVVNLRRVKDDCRQEKDGTWLFRVQMLARVHRPAT